MLRLKYLVILSVLVVWGFLFGCSPGLYGTKIELNSYSPALKGDFSDYSGKKIYLMNFDNQAGNTTIWYYYSSDKDFTYGGASLIHNYFWYAFQKALLNLGMDVSIANSPDPRAPGMWMTLKSATEDQYTGEVSLQKHGKPFFIKIYSAAADPLPEDQRTPGNLEKRAYDMTNRLIETILADPEFKKAFLKATAELAPGLAPGPQKL
ncbi:MAG: hypothetical protein JW943_11810 [Deltaproteobacteria bacterium]|nr:hypothetical protein [Deltaproteobacteria bacterium]